MKQLRKPYIKKHRILTKKEKIQLSVLVGFSFSFIFNLFGILFIFMSNFHEFMIPFYAIIWPSTIIFLIAGTLLSAIMFIMPKKADSIIISLMAGIILAGYIQGNFLNNMVDLGKLTGDEINWNNFQTQAYIGILIWIIIILLPIIVRLFSTLMIWKRCIYIVCILLAGMQASALITFYFNNREDLHYTPNYYLSREGTYEVSSLGNIMIFVVDRLDYEYVEQVRESDPNFFDKLDGFTEFTNTVSPFPATFPSGTFMTTGIEYDYIVKKNEYFDYAWSNSEFITVLKDNEYSMKYHMMHSYMYSDYAQIIDIADNIKEGRPVPTITSVIKRFTKLSLYRFSPLILKNQFWMPEVRFDISKGTVTEREIVTNNDPLFMELLLENGLNIQDKKRNYIYIHLNGAHAAYTMDENGVYVGESSVVKQTKGCFNIIYKYIDEMKRLGVYDDSTVVILGDHGWGTYNIGYFVKPRGSANAALIQDASPILIPTNFIPTLLQSEGLNNSDFGVSAFDVNEDTELEYIMYRYTIDGEYVEMYMITGDINYEENWELADRWNYKVSFIDGLPVD